MPESDADLTHPWFEPIEPHLYLQRYPKRFTDAEIRDFLAFMTRLVPTLPAPYAWIVDTGGLLRTNRAQRKMLAEYGEATAARDRIDSAGAAILAHGAIARGLVKTAYLITPPVYPYAIVATEAEGERWARAQLAARGVQLGGAGE